MSDQVDTIDNISDTVRAPLRHNDVTILLVEDDEGHQKLIQKNLRRSGITNNIVTLGDGKQALDFLYGEGGAVFSDPPMKMLMMLDLNMPVVDGYQVLQRLKSDDRTKHIPVITLTTTNNPSEVKRCYELGCNVYISKPVEYEDFARAIREIGLFLSVVSLPYGN